MKSEDFIRGARAGIQSATDMHKSIWHLGEELRWDVNLEHGDIIWTMPDDIIITAPIQVVGTYNREDSTFLWGWDHPNVPEVLRAHAALCREWGERLGEILYTDRKIECDFNLGWEFTAVAMRLGEANGGYCGATGDGPAIFVTFGEIQIRKQNNDH